MRTRRSKVTLAAAVALAFVLASCGSSSSSPSSSPVVTVPVTMTDQVLGSVPVVRAVVHVSIGGGPSIPVLLDTGSPGLRVLPQAVSSGVTLTNNTTSALFGPGETFVGQVARVRLTIGSVSTSAPIDIQVIRSVECPQSQPGCDPGSFLRDAFEGSGAVGLLGIDTSSPQPSELVYSPLLQLPVPYSQGFSLRLSRAGTGQLVLGRPASGSGSVTTALQPAQPSTYPTGARAFQRAVRMCWTVGAARSCDITAFDIGMPTTTLSPQAAAGASAISYRGVRLISPGTAVSVAVPGGPVVWSYSANTQVGSGLTQVSAAGGAGLNTGIVPFFTNVIGWDLLGGRLVISPR